MVWVVDDLAEAAFGPWGLAAALGVGVIAAARNRVPSSRPTVAVPAWAAGGLGGVYAVADGVKDRVQSSWSGVESYWRDLYDEAYREWEQRGGGTSATRAIASPKARVAAPVGAIASARRVRGPNGRYVRVES
jgi:hypothetical protein